MSEKRYTAQEMREVERDLCVHRYPVIEVARRMLRQAADAEEENAKLRETINSDSASMAGKDAVIAQLKARMEAVEKECEAIKSHYEKVVLSQLPVTLVVEANRILRAARGEGGAE